MELNQFRVKELREAVRQIAPETRGVGGLGHVGNKEQLIALLQQKGIMPGEVSEILAGNTKLKAPETPEEGFLVSTTQNPEEGASADVSGGTTSMNLPEGSGAIPPSEPETNELPGMPPQEDSEPPKDELEIIRDIITRNVQKQLPKCEIDEEKVGAIIDRKLDEFRSQMVKTIEVKQIDGSVKPIGISHRMTERIAQVANLGIHQMLVGPAGGGKTTTAEKVAEILNLKFYPVSVGPQTTKSDLLGFVDAAGNYHSTPLRDAFENGGLLLLDEVDAANAGVLTIINSLLANGYCAFPDAIIQKHPDFRCVCACNTYGRGADCQYVGRNQLDAATLDRFAVVDFDYDEQMELALAGNPEWTKKVQRWRKRAFDLKMRVVISPRASIFGARLLAAGLPEKDVEDLVVWKGITDDMKLKIRG